MTIAFAMVFFGLVTGVRPVELVVGPEVARMELLLDGELVAERTGPPWTVSCDFGPELAPHELVAVARDADGEELGRARQWVNLPPWDARTETEGAERTAVAVEVRRRGRRLGLETVSKHLEVGDRPAEPVALGTGDAEVIVVLDREAQEGLRVLANHWGTVTAGLPSSEFSPNTRGVGPTGRKQNLLLRMGNNTESDEGVPVWHRNLQRELLLKEGQLVRFLWPYAPPNADVRFSLFDRTGDHPPSVGGMLWFLSMVKQPDVSELEQRLADAVAVAGMEAAGGRRRAVLLVLSRGPSDASRLSPATVRRYLEHLGVPLHVWSIGEPSVEVAEAWGEIVPVSRQNWFEQAVEKLSESLERQRIVWIEGLHLPQTVTLAEEAKGLRLAR